MADPPIRKPELNLIFPSNPVAVRQALGSSLNGLRHLGLTVEERGVVEIVLAEVLNNIVEHAHADHENGVIELKVNRAGEDLIFKVVDDGVPFPGGDLPEGKPHNLDVQLQDLPEGGFGWFMIKELTHQLSYLRDGTRNILSFRIALEKTKIA
ncbi:ATP-binding protein [Aliiroseovarius marinus]|uniref:ATP-binding protein n=1 Tax=Aliiroseovarius marinus TaxID=2500159 RepID=UPI003D7EA4FA